MKGTADFFPRAVSVNNVSVIPIIDKLFQLLEGRAGKHSVHFIRFNYESIEIITLFKASGFSENSPLFFVGQIESFREGERFFFRMREPV